jgi:predicted XRE-type DNA-binding protein
MSISQPDVSKLLRGRVTGFSLERLFEFVRALGNDVEIRIKKTRSRKGRKVRLLEDV